MRRILTVLIVAFVVPLASVRAQRVISGVVFDSLRSLSPIVNGEVILVGTGRRTRTDSSGRFSFTGVDTSARAVAVWAPWLDSLGLPPLRAELSAMPATDEHVVLSTPSLATYQRAVCGTALGANDGILFGETRNSAGEPRSGTIVAARWTQTIIGVGQLDESLIATIDTSSAAGIFTLCGVPIETAVSVRAFGTASASGERVVYISAPVQRHDLIVGPDNVLTRISGRIVGPDSVGMSGATISVRGDSARFAITDASGAFDLGGVPRRSADLVIRAVGSAPAVESVDPVGAVVDVGTIALEPLPPELAAVRVTAGPFERERLEFERRRQGALGDFVTDEMLERIPSISANVVASMVPRLIAGGSYPKLKLRRGFGFCDPRFFVDGLDVGTLGYVEQKLLLERAKRIEVYTANQAPPKFNDFDGCGAVVVWTR